MGSIIRNISPNVLNQVVYKCGCKSGFTWGQFSDGKISCKFLDCRGNVASLQNQYEIIATHDQFFLSGDSGAAVYVKNEDEFCLLGIAIGSDLSGEQLYMTPISAVLKALGSSYEINCFPSEEAMQ